VNKFLTNLTILLSRAALVVQKTMSTVHVQMGHRKVSWCIVDNVALFYNYAKG